MCDSQSVYGMKPAEVQFAFLHTIPGLEACHMIRAGYAVEYDCVLPTQLHPWLETKRVGGLFLFKSSAVDFANHQSEPVRCALVFPTESFELDVENGGNPLIVLAARLLERANQLLARVIARQRT